jgi:hypothetical protein
VVGSYEDISETSGSLKGGECLVLQSDYELLKKGSASRSW